MGNILSCCWKRSASPSASPNASPSPVLHSVLVNQVVDELNVCVPSTRISVAVPPTIAALEYGDLDDLDFDVGQPVWRMSDLKMLTETDLELIPSDNPRASTIFLKKSQKNGLETLTGLEIPSQGTRGQDFIAYDSRSTKGKVPLSVKEHSTVKDESFNMCFHVQGKNMKNNSYHVPPGLCGKHSSCSTIFLDESTISEPNVRITVHCLVFAIYYHIKNRDANRTKDIFEEHLHPFIVSVSIIEGETDPKEYFHRCPDLGSIYNFIRPFFTAYQLTGEFAVATLIYIERLVMYAKIDICPTNWKRVVLGAILLAFKYLYDLLIWNVHFCRIMKSITLKDLNALERQYIYLLQFNLNVSASVYAKYYFDLRTLAGDHGLPIVFAPLRKERARKLEAISRYCENPNLCRVAIKKFSSCGNFTDPQIANAILS